jgi:hypothetical protein
MKIPRWAQVLIGVAIVAVFLGIGAIIAVTAWFSENLVVNASTARQADEAFDKIRQRFNGQRPLVEIRDGVVTRGTDRTAPATPQALKTLHVLAWDSNDEKLAEVSVPWWVLRLKSGPIRFSAYASGLDDEGVRLRPEDIE